MVNLSRMIEGKRERKEKIKMIEDGSLTLSLTTTTSSTTLYFFIEVFCVLASLQWHFLSLL
jgi:hypothetical protein